MHEKKTRWNPVFCFVFNGNPGRKMAVAQYYKLWRSQDCKKRSTASQDSIRLLVQNRQSQNCQVQEGVCWSGLGCGQKFTPCPCPESVSSKQVPQVSAPAGFSQTSNNRRPDGRGQVGAREKPGSFFLLLPASGCLLGGRQLSTVVPAPHTALATLPGPLITPALMETVPLC